MRFNVASDRDLNSIQTSVLIGSDRDDFIDSIHLSLQLLVMLVMMVIISIAIKISNKKKIEKKQTGNDCWGGCSSESKRINWWNVSMFVHFCTKFFLLWKKEKSGEECGLLRGNTRIKSQIFFFAKIYQIILKFNMALFYVILSSTLSLFFFLNLAFPWRNSTKDKSCVACMRLWKK